MTGLFGPNGAGKTTLVNVLTGFQPASDEIFLGGVDVSRLKPDKLRRLGIARIFQGGRHPGRGRSGIRSADGGARTGGLRAGDLRVSAP